MIRTIFVNAQERRLRMLWRLEVFVGLFAAVLVLVTALAGFIFSVAMLASGAAASQSDLMAAMTGRFAGLISGLGGLLAMIVTLLVMTKIDRRPLRDFGFRFSSSWWRDFVFGLLLGAVLMALIFAVELAAGWVTVTGTFASFVPGQPFWQGILFNLILFACVGIYEEGLSRGYLLRNLAEGLNRKILSPRAALMLAYVLSSAVFGLLHAGNPNASLISTFNIFLAGLFLGLGFVLTGELAISIGLHITWNFFQGNVFGFRVSGTGSPASFIDIQQGGPDLWTGGAFGPEAGFIGLLAIALGSLLIWLWVRHQYGQARLQDRLAQYQPMRPAEAMAAQSQPAD